MSLLESIRAPRDVRALDADQLPQLAGEVRAFLSEAVCRTGGHLGANLGVVELAIALNWVFDSPRDRIPQALRDAEVDVPLRDFGIPPRFLEHAKRGEVLADLGLTPAALIGASLARIEEKEGADDQR